MGDVLNIMSESLTSERLDSILMGNKNYLQTIGEIERLTALVDESGFTSEQKRLIDELVSAHEASASYYNRLVYQQAYRDCISLLKEIKLLE